MAALATGCGTGADKRKVRSTVERFFAAVDRREGRAACRRLSEEASSKLESSEKRPCPRAVLGVGLSGSGVTKVEVFITSARADLADGEAAFLDKTPGGWKISAAGCKPRGDMPYDCELEA
jgi:hypothetical protein